MPLKIAEIQPHSPAARASMQAGDTIFTINDNAVNDLIDLQYHSADDVLRIAVETSGKKQKSILLKQDWQSPLGIVPAPIQCRTCANNCIFCFVDQMRPGFRDTLYIKDDDYRLSFLHGNFITLTNLSPPDFKRIIEQKLSPLYISVHTTNPALHKKMLRFKHNFDIRQSLIRLSENDIKLHTQIVIVPDWNAGNQLRKTLTDLTSEPISALSVGIVPVGLTGFRSSLSSIRPVDKSLAQELLEITESYPSTFCSDEIYLRAEKPLPEDEFYEGYPQLENGIGMLRLFRENWRLNKKKFLREIRKNDNQLVFITGLLAAKEIAALSAEINAVLPEKTRVVSIRNHFFGETVTVSGLLAARDIFSQVNLSAGEIAVLSGNMFNQDGLSLDNIEIQDFKERFRSPVLVVDEEFAGWQFI